MPATAIGVIGYLLVGKEIAVTIARHQFAAAIAIEIGNDLALTQLVLALTGIVQHGDLRQLVGGRTFEHLQERATARAQEEFGLAVAVEIGRFPTPYTALFP